MFCFRVLCFLGSVIVGFGKEVAFLSYLVFVCVFFIVVILVFYGYYSKLGGCCGVGGLGKITVFFKSWLSYVFFFNLFFYF